MNSVKACLLSLSWAFIAALAAPISAHELRPAIAQVDFTEAEVTMELSLNLEAVLAEVGPGHSDTNDSPNAATYNQLRRLPPAELQSRWMAFAPAYLSSLVLEVDGVRVQPWLQGVRVPEVGDTTVARISHLQLAGRLPAAARLFRLSYAERYGDLILRLPGEAAGERVAVWLKAGARSDPYRIGLGLQAPPWWETATQYIGLGFAHILPKGLDHVLFVLGLFLLALRLRPLLWQVTAFTVAHTLTLALTLLNVIALPASVVEPLIAASIAYVAIENLFTTRLHAWRLVLVFAFGLLHGMGFAGVLLELGLPRDQFFTGLLSFNLGVELGQLTVILLALAVVGGCRERAWYRRRVVLPASAVIAGAGGYWTLERLFF